MPFGCSHLRLGTSFETALEEVIGRGGDTDTNAAIVGGMLGALHGATNIPAYMTEPVLARTPEMANGRRVLPSLYPRAMLGLCRSMYDRANGVGVAEG